MTQWEPDREWLCVEELHVPANTERVELNVGGYIAGISAQAKSFEGWKRKRSELVELDGLVRVELTGPDGELYGRFFIPIGFGFHKGGVLLPELIPNLDTRFRYRLRFLDPPPALRIFQITCWVNPSDVMQHRESLWNEDR